MRNALLIDPTSPDSTGDHAFDAGAGAEPLYFPSGTHFLFGWLHRPDAVPAGDLGLVVCKPFGYEAICAHRSMRAFAEDAAAVGVPTLSFDYLGTGDSEEIDPSANQLEIWTRDVVAAAAELRRRTGVARVGLLGFRLGALIAALAAAQVGAEALIAVAPIMSGRRYLREMRTIQMASSAEAAAPADGSLEVSGFIFSAATLAALSQLEVPQIAMPSVQQVLIVDRKELPGARAWADALTASGVKTRYEPQPGFVRMMMTAPHFSVIPQGMIAATREWLHSLTPAETAPSAAPDPDHAVQREDRNSKVLQLPYEIAAPGAMLTETAVLLSSESRLFAIVTEPRAGEPRRRGVILLNAGATHHVGPNRMYVTLARRWARRGYVVLRLDLAGLGDSDTRAGRPDGEVYPQAAIDDVRVAVEFIRDRYGITNITLGGLCSGAFHSLRAAAAGLPVRRVLMVNPLNFHWREGMTLQDLTWLGFVHNPRTYLEQVIPSKFWKKLFNRQINVGRLVRLYAEYFQVVAKSALCNTARALHIPLPGYLGYQLEAIAARGIEMVFLFARGDAGPGLLKHLGGSSVKRMGSRCRIHIVDGADHIFSQGGVRATLEQILSDELFAHQHPALRSVDGGLGGQIHGERLS
jgi:alpha-beta hydrolase superfamily lysophospholipase